MDNPDRPPEAGALLARTPVRLWRQYGAHFLRSISIGFLDEVRVDAKGGRSIGVAQTSAYGSYRYALRQQTGCGEMPKIMEADRIQSDGSPYPDELLGHVVGHPRATAVGVHGEDVSRIG